MGKGGFSGKFYAKMEPVAWLKLYRRLLFQGKLPKSLATSQKPTSICQQTLLNEGFSHFAHGWRCLKDPRDANLKSVDNFTAKILIYYE